jgi:glycosyltransferase involved in cell wall biosynthesis
MLRLLSPPAPNPYTGGHLYNARLLEALKGSRPVAHQRLSHLGRDAEPAQVLLLDSLYLDEPENLGELPPSALRVWMVHFLPDDDLSTGEDTRSRLHPRVQASLAAADGFIATSQFMTDRLVARGIPSERICTSVPGLDADYLEGAPASPSEPPVTILTVATLEPRKGQRELLAALAMLSPRVADWRWELVGDLDAAPAYREAFVAEVKRLGLHDRVRCVGTVSPDQLPSHYRKASLFALLTRYEPYGMVVAEATALGVPVFATAVGELPRLVAHGQTGWLCPPDASTEELSQALEHLLTGDGLRAQLRATAVSRRARFPSWSGQAERVSRFIDSLAPRPKRSP